MAFFDMSLEELQTYAPARQEPPDFDAFWQESIAQTRRHPLDARFEPVDYGLRAQETYDVTFAGYDGQPVKGWLLLPRQRPAPVPCVVEYIGYGGGRGFPTDWLLWSSVGFAHLVMDTRGQGQAAALAAAGDGDAACVYRRVAARDFDGPHRVQKDAPVVIRLGVEDALGHEAGVVRAGAFGGQVGRVAPPPGGALTARIHDQVGKADAAP